MRERDEEDREDDDGPYEDDEDPEVVVRDDEDPEDDPDTDADGLRRRFFASWRSAPLCSYLPLCGDFVLEPVCFRGATLASRLGTSTGCVVGRICTGGGSVGARDGTHEDERG